MAGGGADLAAIDWVSWRYARRYRPAAAALRVLMLTDPTPGLPYIAALGADTDRIGRALAAGIAGLDTETREVLGLVGFAPLRARDYRLVAKRLDAAEALLPREAVRTAAEFTPA